MSFLSFWSFLELLDLGKQTVHISAHLFRDAIEALLATPLDARGPFADALCGIQILTYLFLLDIDLASIDSLFDLANLAVTKRMVNLALHEGFLLCLLCYTRFSSTAC